LDQKGNIPSFYRQENTCKFLAAQAMQAGINGDSICQAAFNGMIVGIIQGRSLPGAKKQTRKAQSPDELCVLMFHEMLRRLNFLYAGAFAIIRFGASGL
jgi:hypothetical protein